MSVSSVKAGEAFIELTARDSKLVKGLAAAQAKLRAFADSVNTVGSSMLRYSAAMAIPFSLATKKFAEFDDQMRLVKGITGTTDAELKTLTETAKRLGRETSYTAAQVAAGMVTLARMGFTAQETNRAIADFMNLDRATGMNDLAQSAEIASAAMRSFGLSAADSGRIADVLTATANGSSQSLMDLGEALKMAAPNAHMANASLEDTAALLGVLANMGIKGSMAGSALAKTFQRLASGKGVEVLAGKGIKTTDAQGNLRNMRDILIDIANVTKNMGSAEKIAFLTDVFDVRGAKGGGLISGNIEDLDKMIQKIAESGGTAKKTADEMDSGIGGAFRKFLSAVEGVALELGNAIANYIQPYIDSIGRLLGGLAKWISENQNVGRSVTRLIAQVAAAGAGLLLFSKIMKLIVVGLAVLKFAIAAAAVVFTAFTTVISTLAAGPTLAIIAFAALMTAAFVSISAIAESLSGSINELANGFSNAFASIKSVVSETIPVIKEALAMGDLASAAKVTMKAFYVVWLEGIMPIKKLWNEFVFSMADTWTAFSGATQKLAVGFWYGLLYGLKTIGNAIADAWDETWTAVVNSFNSVIKHIKIAWIAFKAGFDKSINVEAEIRKLEAEDEASSLANWKKTKEETDRRENERAEIERQEEQAKKNIDDETQAEFVRNRKNYDDATKSAEADLASARDEWKKAIEEARKKAREHAEKAPAAEAKNQAQQAAETLQVKSDTKTIAGFDPRAIADALGGSNKDQTAERTAAATENVAQTVRKMYHKMEDGTWSLT